MKITETPKITVSARRPTTGSRLKLGVFVVPNPQATISGIGQTKHPPELLESDRVPRKIKTIPTVQVAKAIMIKAAGIEVRSRETSSRSVEFDLHSLQRLSLVQLEQTSFPQF